MTLAQAMWHFCQDSESLAESKENPTFILIRESKTIEDNSDMGCELKYRKMYLS
jgi:hypothetical protein